MYLLSKYGGVWIDGTVLLTEPIPNYIVKSDFFKFLLPSNHKMRKYYLASNWFIVSKPGNLLIEVMRISLTEYWKHENKLLDYSIFHIIFLNNIEFNEVLAKEWSKCVVLYNENPHALQFFLEEEFNLEKINRLLGVCSIHKMTYNLIFFNEFVDLYKK